MVFPCKPSVAVHDEGDMLWDRSLSDRVDEELLELRGGPFYRRTGQEPAARTGGVELGRHGDCRKRSEWNGKGEPGGCDEDSGELEICSGVETATEVCVETGHGYV